MTPKRWQIVGGYVVSMWFIFMANLPIMIGQLPLNGWTVALGMGAGILGHAVGRFMVREWQGAGR